MVPEEEQPYPVPENWVWVRLKSLNDNKLSQKSIEPSKYADEIFELYSVPSFVQEYPEIIKGEEIKSNKQVVNKNDVLLCKINPRINRVWIVNNHTEYRTIASTEWIVVSPIKNVYPAFLMNAMRSNYFRTLLISNSSGVGGSLTRAKSKDVIEYPIPLPPLPEQKRIVQRVESLLDKINEAKQLIEEAKETFANRRASILAKAFRGELTKKWREENPDVEPADILLERIREEREKLGTNKKGKKRDKELPLIDPPYELPENWVWVRLDKVVSFIGGGTPSKNEQRFWNGNIPWATVKDIKNIYLSKTFDSITKDGLDNSTSSVANPGEVLLVTRMSPGKSTITQIQTAINQDLKIVRPKIEILPFFLWMYFTLNMSLIESLSTGSTVKGIQVAKLNKLPFPLPPLPEQKEIVRRVESLLDKKHEAKQLIGLEEKLNQLKQSILLKAFRGELGTNNPGEESAIELLKETLLKQIKPTTKNQEKNVQQELEFN
nr:restriction endonuclease subunit S [Thermoactinomyces sp. CICC 24227]